MRALRNSLTTELSVRLPIIKKNPGVSGHIVGLAARRHARAERVKEMAKMGDGVKNRDEIEAHCESLKHVMAFQRKTIVSIACVMMPLQYRL